MCACVCVRYRGQRGWVIQREIKRAQPQRNASPAVQENPPKSGPKFLSLLTPAAEKALSDDARTGISCITSASKNVDVLMRFCRGEGVIPDLVTKGFKKRW